MVFRFSVLSLAVTFALCGNLAAQEREQLTIGNVECLSGLHAKAGEQAVAGIRACVDWVNTQHGGVTIGRRKLLLKYLVYDCESNREAVGSLLERLITVDRVDAVIAPYTSGLTLAGAPVAEKYGMVYLDHGGASDEIFEQGFKWIVQTIGPGSKYHVGTLDMLHAHAPEAKRLALIYEDSENPRAVKQGAEEHARKLGYEIVFNQTYPPGVTDLTPLLSAMKAASPDIVIGGGHLEDGQLITRQMADLGIDVQAMSLISAATIPAFYDALGEKANGVMGPSHWEIGVTYSPATAQAEGLTWFGPSQAEFVELFHKHGGANLQPDYHAGEAGAAVLAWVLAVERAGIAKPADVRRALGELKFMSFYGAWGIDETGLQVGHPMVDVQWQNGERVIVWPAAAKTAELQYPLRKFASSSGGPQSFAAQIVGNIIQGLVLGAIYGVATMGLSLIFGVLRIVNVSHGALIMVGAFAAWWVTAMLQVSPLVALPLALVLGARVGLFFYYTALKKLLKAPELASLLATFALGVVLEEVVKHTFTSESRGYAWDIGSLNLGVTTIPIRSLFAAIASAWHRTGHLSVVHAHATGQRDARRRARQSRRGGLRRECAAHLRDGLRHGHQPHRDERGARFHAQPRRHRAWHGARLHAAGVRDRGARRADVAVRSLLRGAALRRDGKRLVLTARANPRHRADRRREIFVVRDAAGHFARAAERFVGGEMKPGAAKYLPIVPVLALYALMFAFGCAADGNWQLVAQIAFYCALAGAFNMFMGLTGYVDFGYVAFVGVGSYGMAIAVSEYSAAGPWVLAIGLGFSLLAATMLALTVGAVALRLRGAYFAIATVGVNEGMRYFIEGTRLFRGSQGILYSPQMNAAFSPEVANKIQTFWADVGIFAVAVTAAIVTLIFFARQSRLRPHRHARRRNGRAGIGIPITRYKLTAFLASAILAGLLGAAKALKTPHLYPVDAFYVHYTIEAIIIVVLGGAGTLSGPIFGAIVYSLVKYYLSIYWPGFQLLIFAPLIIAAVVLFPAGIVGTVKRWTRGTPLESWVL